MNFLKQALSATGFLANQAMKSFQYTACRNMTSFNHLFRPSQHFARPLVSPPTTVHQLLSRGLTLKYMHEHPFIKKYKKKRPLDGKPFAKGVVLKTLIKKPRKPNSANRKCVLLRLSIGKEMIAYVPGEGHNLQEHNTVLVKVARLRDTPGVKLKCVRGVYDLPHVVKKKV